MTYLYNLVCLCLENGEIPSAWREAVVYPIPKPQEWHAQLKNTRPITLLETVRKAVTKLITTRLSNILSEFDVLQGGNFTGLPGGSCSAPIQTLESLLHDARRNRKDLWILSQDISKAFDSINLQMLELAMDRFKIPSLFQQLVISLFTNRINLDKS